MLPNSGSSPRRRRPQPAGQAWVPALSILCTTPFDLLFLLSDNRVLVLAALGVTTAVAAIMIAPTASILHAAVAPSRRALASAILISGGGLIGAGLGPSAAGLLSQYLFADAGTDSLRHALVSLQIFGVSASVFYYLSGRGLRLRRSRDASTASRPA